MQDTTPKKWKLLSSQDVSPSTWFPIENRTYELPNGKIVEDFTVTTLADVAMIIPITKSGKVVVVRQYKPGIDEVTLEFPAGRMESNHADIEETAIDELSEETGIIIQKSDLKYIGTTAPFVTKGTEKVFCYVVTDAEITSAQHLDEHENIQVEVLTFEEFEAELYSKEPIAAVTLAAWEMAKRKFPETFSKK